jgi:drug/metabolite transporter (DMT)-like permease
VTSAGARLGPLQLMVALSVASLPALLLSSTLPSWLLRRWRSRGRVATAAQGDATAQATCKEAAPVAPQLPPSARRRLGAAMAMGLLVSLQCIALFYAASLVPAYLSVMATMCVPLFVAVMEACVSRRAPPRLLLPAVALTLGASALTVAGSWVGAGGAGGLAAVAKERLVAGVMLAFGGALLMAVYMVAVHITRTLVTADEIMWANRVTLGLVCLPFACALEDPSWAWLRVLTPATIGVFIGWASLVFTSANLLLQVAVRGLGSAAPAAVCISLRLVSALAAQAVMLPKEQPANALQVSGVVCVMLTVTGYLLLQLLAPAAITGRHHGREAAGDLESGGSADGKARVESDATAAAGA